jgi:hypothetical protein
LLQRYKEAVSSYSIAMEIKPDCQEAIQSYQRVIGMLAG